MVQAKVRINRKSMNFGTLRLIGKPWIQPGETPKYIFELAVQPHFAFYAEIALQMRHAKMVHRLRDGVKIFQLEFEELLDEQAYTLELARKIAKDIDEYYSSWDVEGYTVDTELRWISGFWLPRKPNIASRIHLMNTPFSVVKRDLEEAAWFEVGQEQLIDVINFPRQPHQVGHSIHVFIKKIYK